MRSHESRAYRRLGLVSRTDYEDCRSCSSCARAPYECEVLRRRWGEEVVCTQSMIQPIQMIFSFEQALTLPVGDLPIISGSRGDNLLRTSPCLPCDPGSDYYAAFWNRAVTPAFAECESQGQTEVTIHESCYTSVCIYAG